MLTETLHFIVTLLLLLLQLKKVFLICCQGQHNLSTLKKLHILSLSLLYSTGLLWLSLVVLLLKSFLFVDLLFSKTQLRHCLSPTMPPSAFSFLLFFFFLQLIIKNLFICSLFHYLNKVAKTKNLLKGYHSNNQK